jgi:uncharacterized lipoprotein YmbA
MTQPPVRFVRPVRLARLVRPLGLTVLAGLAGLAGCGSAPRTGFHTLMAPPAAVTAGTHAAPLAFRIESPVRVPAQVDQPQIVLRAPGGGVQVQEYQRWVAPLSEEWRDAVGDRLVRQLGAVDASRVPAPPGLVRYDLRLDLQRFDAEPGGQAVQQAAWSVLQPTQPGAVISCVTTLWGPAGADVGAVVAAQRELTQRLADGIGAALLALKQGRPPACPGG